MALHDKIFLDLAEAATMFGGSISWWRSIVFRKQISYHKRGDKVCFKRDDLDSYFAERRVPAVGASGNRGADAH